MPHSSSELTAVCSECGFPYIDPNHQGTCPKCGRKTKQGNVVLSENVGVSDSLTIERLMKLKNKRIQAISIILIIICQF